MTHNRTLNSWWKPQRELTLAAQTQVPVMVTAPTSEERRTFARYIHDTSVRCERPFVAVSCSANPPDGDGWHTLVPSTQAPAGASLYSWFSEAAGGTLFVDDLGSMSDTLQDQFSAALCYPLETTHDLHEVRLITGARPAWPTERERKRFSDRLYYRLNVMRVDCVQALEDHLRGQAPGRATSIGPLTRFRSFPSGPNSRLTRGR